jgi:hypothetical protein
VLERARTFMEDTGQPFEAALAVSPGGATSLRPTRRWTPVLTVSLPPSWSNTSAVMPGPFWVFHPTICWALAASTRMTLLNPSIWPTWLYEGAARSTA